MRKPFSLRERLIAQGITDEVELKKHLKFALTISARFGVDLRRYRPSRTPKEVL